MVKIGITGGIGSGKTTICRVWESLGAKVIYADDLARELMTRDEALKREIRSAFGEESYDEKGELNRAHLAREAFDKGRAAELNERVHPEVREEVKRLSAQALREGYPMFVEEAALLLNEGRPEFLDVIVLVEAPEEQRTERVQARDNVDADQVRSRMRRQQDTKQLRVYADHIVVNDGSVEELTERAEKLYYELLGLKKKK